MATGKVRIATCQFAIVKDIDRNFACVVRQMKQARGEGAEEAIDSFRTAPRRPRLRPKAGRLPSYNRGQRTSVGVGAALRL